MANLQVAPSSKMSVLDSETMKQINDDNQPYEDNKRSRS